MSDTRLVVCVNERLAYGQKSCAGSGSRKLIEKMETMLQQQGLNFAVVEQVCLGRCEQGIAMRIAPGGNFFTQVHERDLPSILQQLVEFDEQKNTQL